jgi:hypothetical protein
MFSEKMSASGWSLMDRYTKTNQAALESTANDKPIHASHARRRRITPASGAPASVFRNAGSATKTTKKATPATEIVAAK